MRRETVHDVLDAVGRMQTALSAPLRREQRRTRHLLWICAGLGAVLGAVLTWLSPY